MSSYWGGIFLIKSNLSVLMAERGLKIGDVSEATGISRNTLSSFYNHKAAGIQYETLDRLCEYLGVTPGELLVRIDFQIHLFKTDDLPSGKMRLEFFAKLNNEAINGLIAIADEAEGQLTVDFYLCKDANKKLSVIPQHILLIDIEKKVVECLGTNIKKSKTVLIEKENEE